MNPQPQAVATTLANIIGTPWPTELDAAIAWLEGLGIDTQSATRTSSPGESHSWDLARMPVWGATRVGWGTHLGRLADISWFLWQDATAQEVEGAGKALAQLLTDAHGAPTETTEASATHGASWWWQLPAHHIEMYWHTGLTHPDEHPAGPACIQLAVDLRNLSEQREADAHQLSTKDVNAADFE